MEKSGTSLPWLIVILSVALVVVLLSWLRARKGRSAKPYPPGPPKWPIIGNMLDLGSMPHENLYKLRFKYGPVLWLQIGWVNTMVVQSAKAASEFFKDHDLTFCDRMVPDAMTALSYDKGSMAFGSYGDNWRLLRRLCSTELRRVNETVALRRKCVDNMIGWMEDESNRSHALGGSREVEICKFLFIMAFNVVGNIVISRDILKPESEEGREFFDAMNGFMERAGKPNIADIFPFLKPLDPQKIKRNMVRDIGKAGKIVAEFVKERVEQDKLGTGKMGKDLLDVMLENVGDEKGKFDKITDNSVTIIILEMFFAGSETTSSTIEWAMAELLRDPTTMTKVKEELDQVVGTERKVEESDIDNLNYLHAVVKETLRLHPVAPLLLPRNSMQDCNYMDYFVPKNTQVFVNAWAIGRDPESWEDPLSFKPERFLGNSIEYKGHHFELIPFGSGRRICPALSLAHRVIHLALATMLQTFDWELDGFVDPGTMDMNERMGITSPKLVPLKAIPKRRKMF